MSGGGREILGQVCCEPGGLPERNDKITEPLSLDLLLNDSLQVYRAARRCGKICCAQPCSRRRPEFVSYAKPA